MPGMNVTNASFKWAGSALVPWWVHIKCNKQNALFSLITISFFFGSVVSSLLHGLFSSCGKWGLFSSCSVWVSHCSDFSRWGARTLVSAGFSHGSSHAPEHRLNSCGTWAWLLHGMWDFPRSGINLPVFCTGSEFFTTETSRKHRMPGFKNYCFFNPSSLHPRIQYVKYTQYFLVWV